MEEDQTEVIPHSNPEVIRDLYFPELKLLGIINPVSGRSFCTPSHPLLPTVVKILSFPQCRRRLIFDPCHDGEKANLT